MAERKKVTILDLFQKKKDKEKIVRMAAYDYPTARIAEAAGIDILLVGDSLGMNVLGFEDTLQVTMDMMVLFTGAVRRGAPHTFVVSDLPFGTYFSPEDAFRNSVRLIQAGADAVKLEGGEEVCKIVEALHGAGILVNGHIGLTPQSYKKLGGFKVQGRDVKQAVKLANDAKKLEEAGCVLLLLEAMPALLAKTITERLVIPTVSIGSGPYCDVITIVFHDFAGFSAIPKPRFVKNYCELNTTLLEAMRTYIKEAKSGEYPSQDHCYPWDKKQEEEFLALLQEIDKH